jgi:hypothetical protein
MKRMKETILQWSETQPLIERWNNFECQINKLTTDMMEKQHHLIGAMLKLNEGSDLEAEAAMRSI